MTLSTTQKDDLSPQGPSDRVEPSKNIVRGFLAFDLLLERAPAWRERVVFVAMLNESRQGLPEYQAYRQEVEQAAARVNERWARPGWATSSASN